MRIVFMGTPDFAVLSLDAIMQAGHDVAAVVTVPDRPSGRGQKLTTSPVKNYAVEHNLPLLQPEKLRDPQFLADLQALQAELFVVVAFRMLPQMVWAMPPRGTFNLHASLLPDYRGAAPINWAIINGEKETGVTTFLLNERIDEGKILLQERTPITEKDNTESLHDRLAEMGAALVVKTIKELADDTLQPYEQPTAIAPKAAPKIFKEDCAIPWNWPGEKIVRFVRGLSPYPAATMRLRDAKGEVQNFKVYDVRYEATTPSIPYLSVSCEQKKRIKIALHDGNIEILSLQINGKKKNSAEEFLRGHDITNWEIIQ